MRKRILCLAITLIFILAACASIHTKNTKSKTQYELAQVTDTGPLNDGSFNQGVWEGLKRYANENDKTYTCYHAEEMSTRAFETAIQKAIQKGAKVIVCSGNLFEPVIYDMQTRYPDIHFILIDGEPHDQAGNYQTAINTCAIMYKEDQAGYLAGYAAVKEGYTHLGFMGGMALPSVKRYGYGFVQGAEKAAEELGIKDVKINYTYTGSFEPSDKVESLASSWYYSGTEVIFACGGAAGNSVMKAAEKRNGKVIGVDVDQSYASDTVITSATKKLSDSVYQTIGDYYHDQFKGGQTLTLNAGTNGIELPMDHSKFSHFTNQDYQSIYSQLASGQIIPLTDLDIDDVTEIPSDHIRLCVIDNK